MLSTELRLLKCWSERPRRLSTVESATTLLGGLDHRVNPDPRFSKAKIPPERCHRLLIELHLFRSIRRTTRWRFRKHCVGSLSNLIRTGGQTQKIVQADGPSKHSSPGKPSVSDFTSKGYRAPNSMTAFLPCPAKFASIPSFLKRFLIELVVSRQHGFDAFYRQLDPPGAAARACNAMSSE